MNKRHVCLFSRQNRTTVAIFKKIVLGKVEELRDIKKVPRKTAHEPFRRPTER